MPPAHGNRVQVTTHVERLTFVKLRERALRDGVSLHECLRRLIEANA